MGLGPDHGDLPGALHALPGEPRPEGPPSNKVWAFLGDGETDEPETLGALTLASREKLDNLIFVINCNLQRLDGPVRGNGRSSRNSKARSAAPAGTSIKVIWGTDWDDLLARDKTACSSRRMAEVVDGEYQRRRCRSGAYIREKFFGKYPRTARTGGAPLRRAAEEAAARRPRPGKVYAAYKARRRAPGARRR